MTNRALDTVVPIRPDLRAVEQRVADLDDGFTRVANELLDAVLASGFTDIQIHIVMAVWRKTYGWNKKMDWITNEEFERMTTKDSTKCSTAKNQLIRMQVLVQQGRSVGMNKNISEWRTKFNGFGKTFTESVKVSFTKSVKGSLPNQSNTKDTIQKTIKTNPPKAPKGEFSEEIISQAKQVLEYYNELTDTTCRSAEAFAVLLTERSARDAYTVDDLKLVIRWVVLTWRRRNGTVAKPANICRVNRFDGYLADAGSWETNQVEVNCDAVIDAYNELAMNRLEWAEIDEGRVIAIRRLAAEFPRTRPANESFQLYFSAFFNEAREDFFGKNARGWHANFDWLMKIETLTLVRRRNHV